MRVSSRRETGPQYALANPTVISLSEIAQALGVIHMELVQKE